MPIFTRAQSNPSFPGNLPNPNPQFQNLQPTLDSLFNAYVQMKNQERLDSADVRASEEYRRRVAAQNAEESARFGAPLSTFAPGEIQSAAKASMTPQMPALPQQFQSIPGVNLPVGNPLATSGMGPLNAQGSERMSMLISGLARLGGRDPQSMRAAALKSRDAESEINLRGAQADLARANAQKALSEAGRTPAEAMPKQNEFVARTFADMASQAEQSLGQLTQGGYNPTDSVLSTIGLPNIMQTEPTQKFEQAGRQFVQAVLRRESGATITPDEMKQNMAKYWPRRGDSPGVLEQKAEARRLAVAGLNAEGARVPSNAAPQRLGPPKVGEIRKGYRFKGGNPADQSSWEKS